MPPYTNPGITATKSDKFDSFATGALRAFTGMLKQRQDEEFEKRRETRREERAIREEQRREESTRRLLSDRAEIDRETDRIRKDRGLEISKALKMFEVGELGPLETAQAIDKINQTADAARDILVRQMGDEEYKQALREKGALDILPELQKIFAKGEADKAKKEKPQVPANEEEYNKRVADLGEDIFNLPVSDISKYPFGSFVVDAQIPDRADAIREDFSESSARSIVLRPGTPEGTWGPTTEMAYQQQVLAQAATDITNPENMNSPIRQTQVRQLFHNNPAHGFVSVDMAREISQTLTDPNGNPIPITGFVPVPSGSPLGPSEKLTIDDIINALYLSGATDTQITAFLAVMGTRMAEEMAPSYTPPVQPQTPSIGGRIGP